MPDVQSCQKDGQVRGGDPWLSMSMLHYVQTFTDSGLFVMGDKTDNTPCPTSTGEYWNKKETAFRKTFQQ